MKVWITKYALTQGIFECEVETAFDISKKMVVDKAGPCGGNCYHRPDWHETKGAAILRAEEMRTKKIASLEKQIKSLKTLKF